MNRSTWKRWTARCGVPLVLLLAMTIPAGAIDNPKWDLTTKAGPDAQVPGWYLNLGITGARAKLTPDEPKALQVMFVFKDTPAFGKLEKGDKIVGANGNMFLTPHKFGYGMGKFGYEGPLMDLGNALEESQGKRNGKLTLDVLRGEQKLKVELELTTRYGSFSPTYPFDCKKTDLILQETCAYLIKEQMTGAKLIGDLVGPQEQGRNPQNQEGPRQRAPTTSSAWRAIQFFDHSTASRFMSHSGVQWKIMPSISPLLSHCSPKRH